MDFVLGRSWLMKLWTKVSFPLTVTVSFTDQSYESDNFPGLTLHSGVLVESGQWQILLKRPELCCEGWLPQDPETLFIESFQGCDESGKQVISPAAKKPHLQPKTAWILLRCRVHLWKGGPGVGIHIRRKGDHSRGVPLHSLVRGQKGDRRVALIIIYM